MSCPRCAVGQFTWEAEPSRKNAWSCPHCRTKAYSVRVFALFDEPNLEAAMRQGKVDLSRLQKAQDDLVGKLAGQLDFGPMPGQTGSMW